MRSVAQYNSNNSWLYNQDNGCLNNNNKYNTLTCRALDYIDLSLFDKDEFLYLLRLFYESYRECSRKKSNKPSHLEFLYNLPERLVKLVADVIQRKYVPRESICFIILYPKIREVIAPDFVDRIVQTFYVLELEPYLERLWFVDDSYSCRKGKGGIKAVLKLQEYVRQETKEYTEDVILVKRDIRSFFPSIDPDVVVNIMTAFIKEEYPDGYMKDLLLYLTPAIYKSCPQKNCRYHGDPALMDLLDPKKRIMGKDNGLPIGNRTSQLAANVITTPYLLLLQILGYKFVHYTDDTAIIVHDYKRWQKDEKTIENFISKKLHLKWHPDKKYVQHYSKGIEFLGFKIKKDRILPSDRVAHNFIWNVERAIKKTNENENYMYINKESFMQTVNSYTGLLKWTSSNMLLCREFDKMIGSELCDFYDFTPLDKINVKESKTRESYFGFINKQEKVEKRKKEINKRKQYEKS